MSFTIMTYGIVIDVMNQTHENNNISTALQYTCIHYAKTL